MQLHGIKSTDGKQAGFIMLVIPLKKKKSYSQTCTIIVDQG